MKILDRLLIFEKPLLQQMGECILKDFGVIYNFLAFVMAKQ